MWSERKRALWAIGGFGALTSLVVGVGWWSYSMAPELAQPRAKAHDAVEIKFESGSFEAWDNDEVRQWRTARVSARVVQASKDRSTIQARDVYDVNLYYRGEIRFRGSAGAARYEEGGTGTLLVLFDGVQLEEQKEDGYVLRTKELTYRGGEELVECPWPITVDFPDATMKTGSLELDLSTEPDIMNCPGQVVVTTERGATLVARKAQAELHDDDEIFHLLSSVVGNLTVGEAEHLAEEENGPEPAPPATAEGEDERQRTRVRIFTHQLDYAVRTGVATSPRHTIIRTAAGSASADTAEVEEDYIRLMGHAVAQFEMEDEGLTTIRTHIMEYKSADDEFSTPGRTRVDTESAVVVCGNAKAWPSENHLVMAGGVSGAIEASRE